MSIASQRCVEVADLDEESELPACLQNKGRSHGSLWEPQQQQ
jgi:hypothetical protein